MLLTEHFEITATLINTITNIDKKIMKTAAACIVSSQG